MDSEVEKNLSMIAAHAEKRISSGNSTLNEIRNELGLSSIKKDACDNPLIKKD